MQTQPRTILKTPRVADELTTKHDVITCLLDHYRANGTLTDEFDKICELQALELHELSILLDIQIGLALQDIYRKFNSM